MPMRAAVSASCTGPWPGMTRVISWRSIASSSRSVVARASATPWVQNGYVIADR